MTQRNRLRGKRGGTRNRLRLQAHRPPLPSILLANIQSLDNKLDELRARIRYQRDTRDCNIICLTETWLTPTLLDHAIQPVEFFTVHRMDRMAESGTSRGGGVCLMTNNNWCRDVVCLSKSCSPNLELLTIKCWPFYLPQEFTSVILSAVYIHPQADTDAALAELHEAISSYQANHREAALIVAGDFNSANLRKAMPELRQHIAFPTRGDRTLDHCYSPFRDGYAAKTQPPFGRSDHDSILLLPRYKQRLKRAALLEREVSRWSDPAEAALQDTLETADWNMFQHSSVEDTIPKRKIKEFPNQKPWMNKGIPDALKSCTAAYNTGLATRDMGLYRAATYSVRRAMREAKQRYGEKLESQPQRRDIRGLWQGLRTVMDYKATLMPMIGHLILSTHSRSVGQRWSEWRASSTWVSTSRRT
nr:PREDICTED: uncharacterized protein LOC103362331 [Stegastes partitus]